MRLFSRDPEQRHQARAKTALTAAGVVFLLAVAGTAPFALGLVVGLFWRGFRLVNGW